MLSVFYLLFIQLIYQCIKNTSQPLKDLIQARLYF